ncbi:MAG: STAS domain-containing protein [Reichenbachiella sp.]
MVNIDSHIDEEKGYYEMIVDGEVDASSSIHLDEALNVALESGKNIIVDLSKLEYISSAGLGVFMSIIQRLENEHIGFVLYGMKEKVMEVFEILGLNQLLSIENTKEEALQSIDHA